VLVAVCKALLKKALPCLWLHCLMLQKLAMLQVPHHLRELWTSLGSQIHRRVVETLLWMR
jgi:hypothetical protein